MSISSRSFNKSFTFHNFVFFLLLLAGLGLWAELSFASGDEKETASEESGLNSRNQKARAEVERAKAKGFKVATFAGGCFWCMEPPFEKLEGVEAVVSGYMADPKTKMIPSYGTVSSGQTPFLEVVQVFYDAKKIKFTKLMDVFWRNINPTQNDGQFVDKGPQYRTAIFYHNRGQKRIAEKAKAALGKDARFNGKPIVTEIRLAAEFYPAEDYHQDYYKTNSFNYKMYRRGSKRDEYIETTWGEVNSSSEKKKEQQSK